jgi:hypothetical protein
MKSQSKSFEFYAREPYSRAGEGELRIPCESLEWKKRNVNAENFKTAWYSYIPPLKPEETKYRKGF